MENRKIEKIRLSNRCSWMPAMLDCTYKYFDKSFDPSPSVRRKICKNLPTGNCSPIENSQGAYFQQKRKNNTGFEQTEKKEKIYPPRRNQRIEKLVSRDPVPETCFHRCNVPCRVKKCDFSNNLRIHTRNTGTKRIQEGHNSFIPPSFRTYTTPNKSGRGELTRPRYLI